MRIDFEHEREALLNASGRQDCESGEQRNEIARLTEALEAAESAAFF